MRWSLIPLSLILGGCDASLPPPETERRPNPAFEAQIQAVEKARAVDRQMQEAAAAQRKQMDEAAQ